MKKQLLIAAVAATMTSAAIADVSITGSGKLNYTTTDNESSADTNLFGTDLVLEVVGKSGDTSVVFKQEFNDTASTAGTAMETKAAYMASNIAGVDVKAGSWISSDSNLGNGTIADGRFDAQYTIEGVTVQYENKNTADGGSVAGAASTGSWTLSGDVQGVSISHEMHENDDTDTKVSASIAGVDASYRSFSDDSDSSNGDKRAVTLSTEYNGVTFAYADIDVKGTGQTSSDNFFGTFGGTCTTTTTLDTCINEATGFSLSTAIAGNTVTLKSYDVKTASTNNDDEFIKVVVTRPLASGATFEATYTDEDDKNGSTDTEKLDLELNVKF